MKRMTLIGAVALGVTLVWACSSAVEEFVLTPDASADDSPSESKSGSRLQIRPIVYEGDDGSVIRMGEEIFDTELGVVCEPGLAADGVMRCLPKGGPFVVMGFADDECTARAHHASAPGCEGDFVLTPLDSEGCDLDLSARRSVYRLGETTPGYGRSNGECGPGGLTVRKIFEVPPHEMVQLVR